MLLVLQSVLDLKLQYADLTLVCTIVCPVVCTEVCKLYCSLH